MKTDTPETDMAVDDTALENKNHPHTDWVTAFFARNLERERNEARQAIHDLSQRLTEKDAQIVALREALESNMKKWRSLVNSGDSGNWNPEEDAHIILGEKALAAQPPAVVPLEDVRNLVEAAEKVRHWHDTNEGVIVSAKSFWGLREAISTFTAKHRL